MWLSMGRWDYRWEVITRSNYWDGRLGRRPAGKSSRQMLRMGKEVETFLTVGRGKRFCLGPFPLSSATTTSAALRYLPGIPCTEPPSAVHLTHALRLHAYWYYLPYGLRAFGLQVCRRHQLTITWCCCA